MSLEESRGALFRHTRTLNSLQVEGREESIISDECEAPLADTSDLLYAGAWNSRNNLQLSRTPPRYKSTRSRSPSANPRTTAKRSSSSPHPWQPNLRPLARVSCVENWPTAVTRRALASRTSGTLGARKSAHLAANQHRRARRRHYMIFAGADCRCHLPNSGTGGICCCL